MRTCGGCEGKGAHIRWCKAVVGHSAAFYGMLSERAESLADTIGGNDPGSANLCYTAGSRLKEKAVILAMGFEGVNRDGT